MNRKDGEPGFLVPPEREQPRGTNGILGLTLTCRGTDDPRPAVYAAIKATDWILVEFVQQTKNLETIFRELTKEN